MMSRNSCAVTPSARVSAVASAIVSSAAAIMKLPAILMTFARSGASPTGHTRAPMASSSGRTRATSAGAPAASTCSLPATTASGRPNTGAAT